MRLSYAPYLLKFKEPSGTSRGVLKQKLTFFIKVYDEEQPDKFGIGEAAVFPGLSPEAGENYIPKLKQLQENITLGRTTDLSLHSSIQFGLEQALLDYSNGCKGIYFPGPFTEGKNDIEINGLIWMGDLEKMIERINRKLEEGFTCLKLKIGSLSWDKELKMIKYIRSNFDYNKLMIRCDANGGFPIHDALSRLEQLSEYQIHSVEQPIPACHYREMAHICKESPVPIALDEELIGINRKENKQELLEAIRPAFIILKPALCGGFSGGTEWIELTNRLNIGWWITSALESNIGLNAIAQWTARLHAQGYQGLGTGQLFTNNFSVPLRLKSYRLSFLPSEHFDYSQFNEFEWQN